MTPGNREREAFDIQELYRPPTVDEPAREAPIATGAFYVVSQQKLLLLFVLTLGLYAFYWFFEHWRRYRAQSREDVSPFWRAVFSIFFAHRLFRSIDAAAAEAKHSVVWSADGMATLYVVLAILAHVADRITSLVLPGSLDMVALVCGMGVVYPLYVAQRVANVAAGDPEGASNRNFTAVNYVFMLLGSVLWLLIFVGLTIEDS